MEIINLEYRVEMLEKIVKRIIGESAWNHEVNGTSVRDSAGDIGNPECGSMN